jgi:hypothetical protein
MKEETECKKGALNYNMVPLYERRLALALPVCRVARQGSLA